MVSEQVRAKFEKQGYRIVGNHSAIKICEWCKNSIRGKGVCYKQEFYPEFVESHRCVQMSCTLANCSQRCIFCWRDLSHTEPGQIKRPEDPRDIIEGCIKAHKEILQGFKGNDRVDLRKFQEAMQPKQFAISLTGESCLYPYLGELIKELHKKKIVSFLVSNGQHPEVLQKLNSEDALPTQLYVSLDAPNKELYEQINQPLNKDGWIRLNKTLKLLQKLKCRRVLRLTIIKGLNDCLIEEWAKLIKLTKVNFIECKSYMHLGYSRERLKRSNMLSYEDIIDFAEKLAKEIKWKIKDSNKRSRVALLSN